ncbi:SH3 domain-containing protein [Sphingomonas sp.]|uniref:SH3 domain-containing protein n=1 Tax=Sphingomonas sp. TaxID=28214 RepID=UPI0035C7D9B2
MPHPSGPQSTPDRAADAALDGSAPSEAAPRIGERVPRLTFALTGPSRALDPRTEAVRADVADVRLADRVFAPHYAAPLRRTVARDEQLRDARGRDAAVLVPLARGAAFDLLDLTGGVAWGIAVDAGLVGYVDADAVAPQ